MSLRRKLLAFLHNQKKKAEYTELAYLESTGEQWIDTEIPYQASKAKINLCYIESATRELMGFGPYSGAYIDKTTEGLLGLGAEINIQNSNAYKWQEIVYTADGNKLPATAKIVSPDGSVTRTASMGGIPGTFYLFAVYGSTSYNCRVKISRAKFYNKNDELIADLIPVLDKDLVPCMYDKVSGKYSYNQGEGEFKWKLPNQLEYLESDGNQWIDTGFIGNQDTEIQTQFLITRTSQRVYGSYATGKNITAYESTNGGNHRFGNQTALIVAPLNTPITIVQNKDGITYNETLYSYTNVNDFETNSTLYVGDINGFASGYRLMGNWYYFKILQNGKIVMYLIPAFDENLNVCMYDLVSKQYFYNEGTGTFKGYFEDGSQLVSYLESTGTQWIDTGVPLAYDLRIKTSVYFNRIVYSGISHFFGGRDVRVGGAGFGMTTVNNTLSSDYFGSRIVTKNSVPIQQWIDIDKDKNIVTVDGNTYTHPESESVLPEYNLRLFGYDADNNNPAEYDGSYQGSVRFQSTEIYKGDKFIHHLIPVLKSDNTPCMYDLISKQYFVNQGSGSFTYGTVANLFNPNNPSYVAGYVSTNYGGNITASTLTDTFYIPCKPNTTYLITRSSVKVNNQVWRAATVSQTPYTGMLCPNFVGGLTNDLTLTITSGANDKYLMFSEGQTMATDDLTKFTVVEIENGEIE